MSAELSIYHQPALTIDGVAFPLPGSLTKSVKGVPAAIAGGRNPYYQRWKIPAGKAVCVWQWGNTRGFTYAELRPVITGGEASGFIEIGMRFNAPTDDAGGDLTPTGTVNHWKTFSKSCVGVWCQDSERAYYHATPTNEVQSGSGALTEDASPKYPGVWDEAARVHGVCDAISVFNEGTEDVYFDLLVIGK